MKHLVLFVPWVTINLIVPNQVEAWDWFKSNEVHTEAGQRAWKSGDLQHALKAFEQAAAALPTEAGAALNQGLALLETNQLDAAKEAFKRADKAGAPRTLRSEAEHALGLAHLRAAEEASKQGQSDKANASLSQAEAAFKRALRLQPGRRDSAWNLELSQRRLKEAEQKNQQEKQQNSQDEQQKSSDENQQQSAEKKSESDQPSKADSQPEKKPETPASPEPKKSDTSNKPDVQKPEQPDKPGQPPQDQALPKPNEQTQPQDKDTLRLLDALRHSEQNFQQHRARVRGQQTNRSVSKDW